MFAEGTSSTWNWNSSTPMFDNFSVGNHTSLFMITFMMIIMNMITFVIMIIIMITRPWPAFGRQGLDGSSGRYNSNW